jgi:ParB/RepB/Spo0J family partition protein
VGDDIVFTETKIPIDLIDESPYNPRKRFDEAKLQELAESIKEVGVLQPLIITRGIGERYDLIAGERRLRAAKMAGLTQVPVVYRNLSASEACSAMVPLPLMLIENLQREDLDPIEEANAFAVLTRDHGWKQVDLAAKIGVSQSHIANRMRLLNLPVLAQEAISSGQLTASAGKELATLAKVPAVREIIEEAIADEDSAQNIVWQAKNTAYNATKPLHKQGYPEPLFQLKDCEGCKYRIMLPERHSGDGKTLPFCMDVSCWEAKQKEAEEEAAEKARQQVLATGEEVIQTSDLSHNAYEYLSTARFDQVECVQCEHHHKARHAYMSDADAPISVCLNPGCYKAKQGAFEKEARRREKELKAAHDERKEDLIAGFFPQSLFEGGKIMQDFPDHQALIYMAAQAVCNPPYSSTMTKAKVEAAVYERYGWEAPEDLSWTDETRHLVRQLATLTVSELLRLIFFVMLKPVEYDSRIFEAVYGEGDAGESD